MFMEQLINAAAWLWRQCRDSIALAMNGQWQDWTAAQLLAWACVAVVCWYGVRPLWKRGRLWRRFGCAARGRRWHFAKVLKIVDGDTLNVRLSWSKTLRVRLQYIDAPESGQNYGDKALAFLRRHAQGQTVLLVCAANPDRYGRILAEVYCPHLPRSLNLTMVEHGWAWAYKATKAYETAQQTAQRKNAGLWRDRRPTHPAEWRKRQGK